MSLYIAGVEVGVNHHTIIDGTNNILVYKFQDMSRQYKDGNTIPSDAEYEEAETYLQQIYKNIMEGEDE